MKQHPDRQPGRAKAVNGGYDDDGDADYELEVESIDGAPLCINLNGTGRALLEARCL